LDDLEKVRIKEGIALEMSWLDRFGRYASFLRNDVRLIVRNKRARVTVLMSIVFLFYGVFMFNTSGKEAIPMTFAVFLAFFSTGGFLMLFGQYVPSWDSSYYPLLMTQNVLYRDYLMSKWLIIALGTFVSTILCFFYIFVDMKLFYLILAMGIFNIGVNGYFVLWGGAYLKTPMDLTAAKNVFGDKNAFNLRVMLISMPKVLLPVLFYFLGSLIYPFWGGFVLLILIGLAGIFFYKYAFQFIEKNYTTAFLDETFLIGYLTAEEYFVFLGSLRGWSRAEVEAFVLEHSAFFNGEVLNQKKYIRDFSKGNQKKIGIIGAFIGNPELVILDEPFANLDPSTQIRLKELVKQKRATRAMTIIISSHDLQHTYEVSDRIIALEKGVLKHDVLTETLTYQELEGFFSTVN